MVSEPRKYSRNYEQKHENIYYRVVTCTEIHEKTRENTRNFEAKPRTGYEELKLVKQLFGAVSGPGGGPVKTNIDRIRGNTTIILDNT